MDLKRPEYLSPSALQIWRRDQQAYFLKYMCHDRPPQVPQNEPMSVGAAFDAYVKSFLHRWIFGDTHERSDFFKLETLFELQVEEQNRDFAWRAGSDCFQQYNSSGALRSLMTLLQGADNIRMEFDETKAIGDATDPVIILGKPDLAFTTKQGLDVENDWKVNGYCSRSGASPVPGYIEMWKDGVRHGAHPDATLWHEKDLHINAEPNLEISKQEWALQLAAYSWLCGCPVGNETYCMVDQLVCHPVKGIRVAQHRCPITPDFQWEVYEAFQELWDITRSDHIFRDLSEAESLQRCQILYKRGMAYIGDDRKTQWLRDQAKKQRRRF